MPYLRVILAFDEGDEEKLRERLDELIEADMYDDTIPPSHITGAYVSDAYEDRNDAIHGEWRQTNPYEEGKWALP
jgi:hypothetical protein